MGRVKDLVIKYKSVIMYVVFGVCTTLVNWGAYYLCYSIIGISNVLSTVIAWILAVAFAFITNKLWVFNSKSFVGKTLIYEMWTFTAARLVTGVLDVGIMYLAVDVFNQNATLWKLISNVIVIILNYVLSKLIVFRKTNSDQPDERIS